MSGPRAAARRVAADNVLAMRRCSLNALRQRCGSAAGALRALRPRVQVGEEVVEVVERDVEAPRAAVEVEAPRAAGEDVVQGRFETGLRWVLDRRRRRL